MTDTPQEKETQPSITQEAPLDIDDDVRLIIGEEPSKEVEQLHLHTSIANRWKGWLTLDLKMGDKEKKKEVDAIMTKYPRSGACSLEAPTLNPEIASALNESLTRRDKYAAATQNLAGSALSALGPVVSKLLANQELSSKDILANVWDAARMIGEIHRSQTKARRACIIPSLPKHLATPLERREPDEFLFGNNLNEKIREIKTMEKLSHELKINPNKKPATQSSTHLNWKGPSSVRKPATQTGFRMQQTHKATFPRNAPQKQTKYPRSNQYGHQPNQNRWKQ